jgi:hypothetical protein
VNNPFRYLKRRINGNKEELATIAAIATVAGRKDIATAVTVAQAIANNAPASSPEKGVPMQSLTTTSYAGTAGRKRFLWFAFWQFVGWGSIYATVLVGWLPPQYQAIASIALTSLCGALSKYASERSKENAPPL